MRNSIITSFSIKFFIISLRTNLDLHFLIIHNFLINKERKG